MSFNTLFFESNKKLTSVKKHNDNISLNEAPEDDIETDPDANPEPNEVGDMSGSEHDTTSELDVASDAETGEEGEEGTNAEDGTPADATDPNAPTTPEGGTDNANGDPNAPTDPNGGGEQTPTADVDGGKKLHLFKNYKSLYNIINNFLEKVADFKEAVETDDSKKNQFEVVDFIEDKLVTLKENVKNILTDRIKTLDYEKSKTIFVHVKSEINLLIKLFDKISIKK
jgi:hypothetical protein